MPETNRNLWAALGLLAVGIMITVFATLYIKKAVEETAQYEFDFLCNEVRLNVVARLAASTQILQSGAALFDASETVTREEWQTFTAHLQLEKQLPGIQGVGFSQLISPDQLPQHVAEIRSQGFPDYQIKPEDRRAIYSSIIYLEPFSGRNLRAFGYDMFSEPVRRSAMELARDEDSVALSGKVILVQETNQDVQAGTLMYFPVYRHGMPTDTVAQRRAAIIGWVYSPYRMTDMLRGTLHGWDVLQQDRQIYLQIYDGNTLSAETLLYDSQSDVDEPRVTSALLITKLTPIDFGGRRWTLRFTQVGGLAATTDYGSAWLVFFGGTTISLLMFWLALSMLNTRTNARKMAELLTAELHESESHLRGAERMAKLGNWRLDLVTNKIIWSAEIYNIFEIDPKKFDAAYEYLLAAIHPEDRDAVNQAYDSSLKTRQPYNITHRLLMPDGRNKYVHERGETFYTEGGQPLHSVGTVQDITEQHQVEEALQKSEGKYRIVADFTYDWEAWRAPNGDYLYISPSCERITGHTAAEFLDNPNLMLQIAHPEDRAMLVDHLSTVSHEIKEQNLEIDFRILTPGGETRWISHSCVAVYEGGQWLGRRESNRDITERKQMDEELRESEERYHTVVSNAPMIIFVTDEKGIFTLLEGKGVENLGLQPNQVVGLSIFDVYHDNSIICNAMKEALNGHSQHHEVGLQNIVFDIIFSPILDLQGMVTKVIGIANDITKRKYLEQELHAERDFATQIINLMGQGLTVTDSEGRFEFVNPAYAHLFGHEPADLVGKKPEDVTLPEDRAELAKQKKLRQAGKTTTYESRLNRANNSIANVLITSVPRGSNEHYNGAIAVITDLTEQKRIEAELLDSKSALELTNHKLEEAVAREEKLSQTDELTGINNRRQLFKLANEMLTAALRYKQPFAILMFDIDHFKMVNDMFGHDMGDLTLVSVIEAVTAEMRASDMIGRYGGEEFIALLPMTSAQQAFALAERFRTKVSALRIASQKGEISVTLSIGIVEVDHVSSSETAEALFRRADEVMYKAKQAGRNCTMIVDTE